MICPNCGFQPKTTRHFRKDGTPRTKIIGRPIKCDPKKATALRELGFSLSQIASKFGCSKGAVQYALRSLK